MLTGPWKQEAQDTVWGPVGTRQVSQEAEGAREECGQESFMCFLGKEPVRRGSQV